MPPGTTPQSFGSLSDAGPLAAGLPGDLSPTASARLGLRFRSLGPLEDSYQICSPPLQHWDPHLYWRDIKYNLWFVIFPLGVSDIDIIISSPKTTRTCWIVFWWFWTKTNNTAQGVKDHYLYPVRYWTRVTVEVGNDDCLQQTGYHQSQANREENIWRQIDERVSMLLTSQSKQ